MRGRASSVIIGGVMLCGLMTIPRAYEPPTHMRIVTQAVNNSVLGSACSDPNSRCVPTDIGLQPLGNDPSTDIQRFPNSITDASGKPVTDEFVKSNSSRSVLQLFQDGVEFEDNPNRPVNHFFDPTTGNPLSVLVIPPELLQWLGGIDYTSPDWALEDNNKTAPISAQIFSYAHARNYFFDALTYSTVTSPTPQSAQADAAYRAQSWGKVFQAIGQVMHHIQDMAQPQHVRNEPHLDKGDWHVGNVQLNPFYHPSLYENYTLTKDISSLLTTTYPALDLTVFTTPRSLWINGGKGIAEFTNSNFFSARTNIGHDPYNLPVLDPTLVDSENIQTLCPPPTCPSTFTGTMTFYGSQVADQNTGGPPTPNSRAVTNSIFSADLKSMGKSPIYTLNRFNFDAAQQFLIPRAVAYSAALINYFFRGQMQISLPDEGVYAVVDHTTFAGSDPATGGFSAVKLKLQNLTPGKDAQGNPIVTPITEGAPRALIAIAKFHRNRCYRADLSGEYGSPGVAWDQPCPYIAQDTQPSRSPIEEIAVSAPVSVPIGINSGPQELTFDFSQNVIPISATDLFLQVVYSGKLGSESDAVVVATKDISEPTYVYEWFGADQELYCAPWPNTTTGSNCSLTYQQWCSTGFASQDACDQAMGFTLKVQYSATAKPIPGYDPSKSTVPPDTPTDLSQEAPFNPVWTVPVPVGSLARVAVLGDAKPSNLSLVVFESIDASHGTRQFSWHNQFLRRTCNGVPREKLRGLVDSSRRPSRFIWLRPIEVTTRSDPVNSLHLRLNPCLTMRDYWHSNRRSWKSRFHRSIGSQFSVTHTPSGGRVELA
jgi:hypothetical protein